MRSIEEEPDPRVDTRVQIAEQHNISCNEGTWNFCKDYDEIQIVKEGGKEKGGEGREGNLWNKILPQAAVRCLLKISIAQSSMQIKKKFW